MDHPPTRAGAILTTIGVTEPLRVAERTSPWRWPRASPETNSTECRRRHKTFLSERLSKLSSSPSFVGGGRANVISKHRYNNSRSVAELSNAHPAFWM